MRLLILATLSVTLVAGSVAAQTPPGPSINELRLNSQREALAPTLRLLNRQDAMVRLRTFSPEELREVEEQTRLVLDRTGTACEVVEAVRVGQTSRRRDLFEVACANGYGYILMNGPSPQAYDCWRLAQVGAALRRSDPRANIGSQCGLDSNGGRQIAEVLPPANRAR